MSDKPSDHDPSAAFSSWLGRAGDRFTGLRPQNVTGISSTAARWWYIAYGIYLLFAVLTIIILLVLALFSLVLLPLAGIFILLAVWNLFKIPLVAVIFLFLAFLERRLLNPYRVHGGRAVSAESKRPSPFFEKSSRMGPLFLVAVWSLFILGGMRLFYLSEIPLLLLPPSLLVAVVVPFFYQRWWASTRATITLFAVTIGTVLFFSIIPM